MPCHCSGAPEHVYMEAIVDGVNIASREHGDDSIGDIILKPHLNHKITLVCKDLTNGNLGQLAQVISLLCLVRLEGTEQ